MPVIRPLAALTIIASLTAAASARQPQQDPPPAPPVTLPGFTHDDAFFPDATYDPAVPTPDSILGFQLGSKPANHAQIESVLKAIAANSPRVKLFEYGKTHEGRTLYYVVIARPDRITNLDQLKTDLAKVSDPRKSNPDALAKSLPAVAWMAYVIHGDEMSGSDAALAALYHLAAGQGDDVKKLLDNLVVIIDPLMNPDGRDRCITAIAEARTRQPQVDDQSLLHTGIWPSGRMNHYLFDMNRDWIFATQPETRGRIAAISQWNPHYFMESHEMGTQDTFLFMPPRDPINPNYPELGMKWVSSFANELAAAFDAHGWRYYTGEWNEEWYPGYSSSWAALRGSIENLYEQASTQSDAIRRAEGTLEPYREAVHKQLVASMTNLTTLANNREKVLTDFIADRRIVLADDSPYAGKTYAIIPGANHSRNSRFLDLMKIQGFETYEANAAFKSGATDRLGREVKDREFPKGTILIPARQPLARLLNAMLEFDPRMKPEFLTVERRELLRFNRSRLYDITGWSIPMLFDVDCYTLNTPLPTGAVRTNEHEAQASANPPGDTTAPASPLVHPETPTAFIINGADDRSVSAAARLMERGIQVRCADKPFQFDGFDYPRGSLLITRKDNPNLGATKPDWVPIGAGSKPPDLACTELCAILEDICAQLNIRATGIKSGLGPGDLPDIGGQHFVLLKPPSIALFGRDPTGPYSYGQAWYTIDHVLGARASYVDFQYLGTAADLRRYNVIVIPDGPREQLAEKLPALKSWVESGGTLIAIGSAASAIATDKGIGSTRILEEALLKPEPFIQAVIREWTGLSETPDPARIYAQTPPTGDNATQFPWDGATGDEKLSDDETKRRDAWRKIFMPQGAILAARTDDRSWLTAGCSDTLPVMFNGDTVLVTPPNVQAPIRLGVFSPAPPPPPPAPTGADATKEPQTKEPRASLPGASGLLNEHEAQVPGASAKQSTDTAPTSSPKAKSESQATANDPAKPTPDKKDTKESKDSKEEKPKKPKPGWLIAPPGQELRLRMSGLLWPEAAERLANTAYITREQIGAGQIILFASDPTFRAATLGPTRVFTNAIIYGPGMGASQPIKP